MHAALHPDRFQAAPCVCGAARRGTGRGSAAGRRGGRPPPRGPIPALWWSAVAYAKRDGAGDGEDRSGTKAGEGDAAAMSAQLHALSQRVEELEGALALLRERAQDRAVGLAASLQEEEHAGQRRVLQAMQHADKGALPSDEGGSGQAAWDKVMAPFHEAVQQGYLRSVTHIRERLMVTEWELTAKPIAMRQGVARFELHCAHVGAPVRYATLSALYDDPSHLDVIQDESLRGVARAMLAQAVEEERARVYSLCTAEAQKLASEFSQADLLKKLVPESGILDALKKLVLPAVKAVM